MLTNYEVYYGLPESEIRDLQKVDEYLIRQLVKGHSKTSLAFLYLECSILPIKFILISRRLMYLKHILSRNEHELIVKVYQRQKAKPVKDDWTLLIERDKATIGLTLTDSQIKEISDYQFKKLVKTKVRNSAFQYLLN